MTVPPLTFRIEKGSPLTAEDHDENLKLLRDFCDGLAKLFEIVFNADGSLKVLSVGNEQLKDRAVTQRKLDWLANFFGTATGVDNYAVTINPVGGFLIDPETGLARAAYGDGVTKSFIVAVKFPAANTGAVTLNLNGEGAVDVKKIFGGVLAPLQAGDIAAGSIHILSYDGTQFQTLSNIPQTTLNTHGIPVFLDPPVEVFNDTIAQAWLRFDTAVPITATALILSCDCKADGPTGGLTPSISIRAALGMAEHVFIQGSAIDGDFNVATQSMFKGAVVGGLLGFDFEVIQGFPQGGIIYLVGYIT
jgi:hypothetical protein